MSAKDHFILELTSVLGEIKQDYYNDAFINTAVCAALEESKTYIGYSFANDLQGQTVKAYLHLICNSEKAREYIAADLRQGLAEELWQNERVAELEKHIELLLSQIDREQEMEPVFDIQIIDAARKALETDNAS